MRGEQSPKSRNACIQIIIDTQTPAFYLCLSKFRNSGEMMFLYYVLLFVQLIVSVGLVVVILSQSSKGGGMGGLLGGQAASMFGAQGASEKLKQVTKMLAFGFMLVAILMAVTVNNLDKSSSVSSPALNRWRQTVLSEQPQTEVGAKEVLPLDAGEAQPARQDNE